MLLSLPLLPEPMVNIWPSNSLQAPTSDAFLGMVALAPLPRPPRPRPALLLFPPRPPRPALEVQAIFSCLEGPTDGRMMALAKKNPQIKYPGFRRAVSSVESYESTFLASFAKQTQTLHYCLSSWRDHPSSPTDLCAWFSLPVFPNELVRAIIFASVLEEFDRAVPDMRICPCQMLV
jgi:hypothetical protein